MLSNVIDTLHAEYYLYPYLFNECITTRQDISTDVMIWLDDNRCIDRTKSESSAPTYVALPSLFCIISIPYQLEILNQYNYKKYKTKIFW